MILTKFTIFLRDSAGPTPWPGLIMRVFRRFHPLFPRDPLFSALQTGHRLFQPPSPQKTIS